MNPTHENITGYSNAEQENKIISDTNTLKEKFYPSGAIAFFIGLVILCLAVWFGIYFLMLERI